MATPPAWKSVAIWVALAWLIFIAFKFEQKYPNSLDPMFDFLGGWADFSFMPFVRAAAGYLQSLFIYMLVLAAAFSAGTLALNKFLEETAPFVVRTVLSLAVGLIVLSMSTAAIGFLGLLKPPVLFGWLVLVTVAGIILAKGRWQTMVNEVKSAKYLSLVDSPAKFLVFFLSALAFLMAFVPEIFYDSLVYHLGLPQMFINEGRILDTPNVYFSRSPMLMHMLYTLAVGLDGGSTVAKLINCTFLMIGVTGAFVLCAQLGWKKAAPWAALVYLAVPIVNMNVWTTAVDSAMGGIFALSVYCLLQWKQSEQKIFWAALAGLFAGAVFSMKYPGLMVTVLMGGMLLLLSVRQLKERRIVKSLAVFSLLAVAVVAPWLVRNYVWTGNPVYPIAAGIFESRNMNHEKMKNEKNITKRSKPQSLQELVTYPWRQTFLEISNFNFIGPMMLGLLPLLLFLPFKEPAVRILAGITFGYFFLELQALGELRYIMPGFLLLGVLLAGGMSVAAETYPLWGGIFKTALIGVALYHLVWIFQTQGRYLSVPLLLGKQSRADYSATMHNGLNLWPWNPMMEDLRRLPEPCRVYILGNEQVFGFPRRFWYSSVHDWTPLVLWANESKDTSELLEKMKAEGFTHLLLNAPEAMRLAGYNLFPWTGQGKKVFTDFANGHLKLVSVKPIAGYDNSLFLFEIQDRVDSPHPFGDFGIFFGKIYNLAAA